MSRARWRDLFGPPVALLGIALLLTAAIPVVGLAAGRQPPAPVACPPALELVSARERHAAPGKARHHADLSVSGELTGQTLVLTTVVGEKSIALPAEAFVGEAAGDLLVYTSYTTAGGSAIHLVDAASGCDTVAATPAQIVRSAVLDPTGTALYVHSVNRKGRADNGVARVDLASGASTVVIPPLKTDDAFGPVFGTLLAWSADGMALGVQSCGFEACLTRVLNPGSGAIATFDARGQGAFIALSATHLVTYGDCPGLPCAVLATDLASGAVATLAESAWEVAVSPNPDGSVDLRIQTAAGKSEVVQ